MNKRGLGPFSGAQLTVILCILIAAVAFPVGAWAVTGSNVFVTDATSGTQAKVDSSGKLLVGDGTGPLSVDGTINARGALPSKPIVIVPQVATNSPVTLYGPMNKAFAIGSLTVSNNACTGASSFVLSALASPGGTTDVEFALVPGQQTIQLDFPVPLVFSPPAGGTVAVQASSNGNCVKVSGVGSQT